MIEITRTIPNPEKLQSWLEQVVRPLLRPDVSNYAKGRLREWVNLEPTLTSPTRLLTSKLQLSTKIIARLKELIEWDFRFALITYSGDKIATGISKHRDASYADYEAMGLNLGEARFDYWMERESFGYSRGSVAETKDPTQSLILRPGEVIRFNCKNPHACSPSLKRWNINFWKAKETS
jgi:hypothetical protein